MCDSIIACNTPSPHPPPETCLATLWRSWPTFWGTFTYSVFFPCILPLASLTFKNILKKPVNTISCNHFLARLKVFPRFSSRSYWGFSFITFYKSHVERNMNAYFVAHNLPDLLPTADSGVSLGMYQTLCLLIKTEHSWY